MPQKKATIVETEKRMAPALSPEARENHMIALAMDLVEQRLMNGTASSQETTHFLKLASTQAKLEQEKIEKELKMIDAKTAQLESQANMEQIYIAAIQAMKSYSGNGDDDNGEII